MPTEAFSRGKSCDSISFPPASLTATFSLITCNKIGRLSEGYSAFGVKLDDNTSMYAYCMDFVFLHMHASA